ncbi:hypothetical protein ADM90_02015 [Lysinibacillus macroides]|uniref:SLH domain-containing protein n=2 Tax=Lysinibacillus macroides TaxID=33935 RepID=A0A0M9DMZ3_9BACI|nr:hypothetical protein ADM90_02015 [Lysinibacillus macroides]
MRTTWQPFDHTQPLVITEEGEHELWFRLADVEERRIIKMDSRLVQPLQLMKTTAANSVIIYVDAKSNGGNGESWTTAYNNLQQALDDAKAKLQVVPTTKLEIWLAAGIYKPTKRTTSNDPRTATFQMQNNVAIYGGFNGTETDLTERDWENNETILSGDIDNIPTDNSGNSYHVFYHPDGLQLNSTAILDGVTITGGNASGANQFYSNSGGGMSNEYSSPTLTHVTFRSNEASYGGGMSNKYSNLTLTNVIFEHNTATHVGGGMYNYNNSSPTLINVTMSGNKTEITDKGAIYGGSPKIYNSLIAGNNGEPALHSSVSATIENSLLDVAESGNILAKFHQSTTDIQPDTYTPEAIFIDPNHVNPSQRNYQLRAGSPAINKGNNTLNATATDLAGNLRIQGGIIDLGAYEAFPYHITYERNDATSGDAPINKLTYQQGDTVTVQNNSGILERTGHTFVGWNTQANGTGDDYAENTSFTMGAQNQTFYAKWIPNNYKVIFESNGGSDVAEQQVLYNEKAIAPPVPSKQGHTFAGWYTDGNEEWDFAMDVVTKDITLYAQWTENPTYTMTYDSNGATGGDVPKDTQRYEENTSVTVQGNSGNLTRTGYTFAGWNTQADGQGDSYAENDTFIMGTSNQILYAQWTENPTYTVTYNPNGATDGDIPEDTQRYEENTSVTVQGNSGNLERTGYTFVGWNTQVDGQGDSYVENDAFIMGTSNQILYAKWIPNPYKVIFESNGGSDVAEQQVLYNEKAIEPPMPSKQGYTFAGWYTDGNDKWDFAIDVVMEDITLYAQWTANPTYTVTYDSNGATDGMVPHDNQVYEEKAQVTVQGNSGNLTRTGYTFVGWNTQADGKGKSYTEKATFQMGTTHIILYAQWTANPNPPPINGGSNVSNDNNDSPPAKVKITLHTNGGTAIAPIDITYNTKIGDLPIPTREGYRFAGWYQDEELTKPWAANTVLRENISLYAKWMALPVEEPQPEPPIPTVTFRDIERHWAKEMIKELTEAGIIQGFEDGTFRPNEVISRMHVAALLTRAFSFEQVREGNDFKDVSPTHPYYEAIMTLQQAGIVDGTNGAFLPSEKMTRAQVAKVLVGLMGQTPEGTGSFTDVASTHWSAGYIAVLEQEGIALGDNDKFNPNVPVTRA